MLEIDLSESSTSEKRQEIYKRHGQFIGIREKHNQEYIFGIVKKTEHKKSSSTEI